MAWIGQRVVKGINLKLDGVAASALLYTEYACGD